MKRKKAILIVSACVLAFLVVSGLIGGCSSSALAPALSASEKAALGATHFNYVIAVDEYNPKIYSDRLIESLRKTNLFKEVDYGNRLSESPNIFAKVNRAVYGSSVIPIFTAITLGFFPTWVEEEHGNSFILTLNDQSNKAIIINSVYRGYTVLGWVSGILNILPNRTSGNSKSHPRYYERLAYDLISALN